ncbi:SDR family oxidoreductase [Noviherbaspirillum sp. Root189]|uniref:SDR family oxidoreductase n=1 Tax=Noviherbaspirillum sp. Root189 TaxID=1736487 RepID=UPI00070B2714|nr:SDR family oxidoreductase [Noviherbaspirillum sp. Root189]KRB69620.1 3-ketoacyl-ACP reductase [Noviherbaspirillum sp. Root189]
MSLLNLLHPAPGLRVLVTAGASGIGAAIARAFSEAGARVHVCDVDRTAVESFTRAHPDITVTVADASVSNDVDLVFDDLNASLGGLDVLVNNVGIAGPTDPIENITTADWERTVAVNVNSQFYFVRRAIPLLKLSERDPCVIAMSSVAGRLGYAYRSPYSASKWAVLGLTKSLAIELGPQGIRVNAILPGVVEGDRMNSVIQARAVATGVSMDTMREEYLRKISLRRMVTPDDIAAMTVFLSSPAARNVTGQTISVDGNVEYL